MTNEQERQRSAPPSTQRQALTLEEARRILYTSFRFSQGVALLQQHLLIYVGRARRFELPDAIMPCLQAWLGQVVRRLVERGLHASLSPDTIDQESQSMIQMMQHCLRKPSFQGENDPEKEALLVEIASMMILIEWQYLTRSQRRVRHMVAGQAERGNLPPAHNPMFSFVCSYLLQDHRTHVKCFDELLATLRIEAFTQRNKLFERIIVPPKIRVALRELVHIYNQEHPGSPLSLDLPPKHQRESL